MRDIRVFSLNFSSAGKQPFVAVEGKICARGSLSCGGGGGGVGGWGSGVRNVAPPLLGNLGANKVL